MFVIPKLSLYVENSCLNMSVSNAEKNNHRTRDMFYTYDYIL